MVENILVVPSFGTKRSLVQGIKVSSHPSTRYGNNELVNTLKSLKILLQKPNLAQIDSNK